MQTSPSNYQKRILLLEQTKGGKIKGVNEDILAEMPLYYARMCKVGSVKDFHLRILLLLV